jgi:hypothetical protein
MQYGLVFLISEKKYFDLERAFQDLAKKYLGNNIKKRELHAAEIWNSRKDSSDQNKKVRQYFEELIQLTAKLHIPVLLGIQQKNPNLTKKTQKNNLEKARELEKARYSLLSLIEHKLAAMNETAVLVADKEGTKIEALKNLVFNRTKWRYSPPIEKTVGLIKPAFLFEYQSHSILDQLHYVDSKESLLMQFADHICFVLKKTLEHLYLLNFPGINGSRPSANKEYLPVTESTFNAFAMFCDVMYAHYNEQMRDVNLGPLSNVSQLQFQFEHPTLAHPTPQVYFRNFQLETPVLQLLRTFTPYS